MMFPTANSTIYRNEDGEVTDWDTVPYDDSPDPDDMYEDFEDEEDDTPYLTDDFDFATEYAAQEEDAWLDSYED